MQKRVSEFCGAINIIDRCGDEDPLISGLAYDSRDVRPGFLFFALPGLHADGHDFIPAAVDAGARAVVHSRPLETCADGVLYLRVENPRTAMSPIAAAFHDHPSREMRVAGITGTDGKSSTVSYLRQLIALSGEKCGFISTVEFHDGERLRKNSFRQSTPEPPEVHKLLQEMLANGCRYAVVEATSHGLSPRNNRLGDVAFDVGVLTNISHEHLEFHGTMEQYVADKSKLFSALPAAVEGGSAVLPAAEAWLPAFREAAGASELLLYGCDRDEADFEAREIVEDEEGISFSLRAGDAIYSCRIGLHGLFNVDNAVAALAAAARLLEKPPADLVPLLDRLQPVRGRMMPVKAGQPFEILVDYAHSPGSFEKLFPMLKARKPARLIALFGSAGERDRAKRPIQGAIASRWADVLFITDEDPRGEDSTAILEEIAAGCSGLERDRNLFLIPDRARAIRAACGFAGPGDLLVCLGKGHEGSIIYADGSRAWDEERALLDALAELGFR